MYISIDHKTALTGMETFEQFQNKLGAVLAGAHRANTFGLDTALEACWLKMVAGFDELLCLPAVKIEKLAYQIQTAKKVLKRMKGRAILADEVGLGKGIEAGLILKELMVRLMVKHALILTPPSLLPQWQEELNTKFGIDARIVDSVDPQWHQPGVWVASAALAKREPHASGLSARMFDLIIVDESHSMRNRQTAMWRLVSGLKSKYLLLLTATPVQNSLEDLFNLITVLMPGQLASPKEFRQRFVESGSKGLMAKNTAAFRALVADVMVRTSRAQAGLELPPRQAQTAVVAPSREERDFYDEASHFLKEQKRDRMTLLMAQRMMGSLPATVLPLLTKLRIPVAVTALTSSSKMLFLEQYLRVLWHEHADAQVLIFTQFAETQHRLSAHFGKIVPCAEIIGGQSAAERHQEILKFQQGARLLISTDAGSEGGNFQFCHHLVNFDIPWNPMRLEQRMGRLHRFGQKEAVSILNLCQQGTLEEPLLGLLDQKLNLFEMVIGELATILGEVEHDTSFEEKMGDLWLESDSIAEFSHKFDALGNGLVHARSGLQSLQKLDAELFS